MMAPTMPEELWTSDPWLDEDGSLFVGLTSNNFFSSCTGLSSGVSTPTKTATPQRAKWADMCDGDDVEECSTTNGSFLSTTFAGIGTEAPQKKGDEDDEDDKEECSTNGSVISAPFTGMGDAASQKKDDIEDNDSYLLPAPFDPELFKTIPEKPTGKVKIQNRKLYVDRSSVAPRLPPPPPPQQPPVLLAMGKDFYPQEDAKAMHAPVMATPPPNHGDNNSSSHTAGSCKQCLFYFSAVGCNKGDRCTFCHISHAHCGSARPSKAKRERYRRLFTAISSSPPQEQVASVASSAAAGWHKGPRPR